MAERPHVLMIAQSRYIMDPRVRREAEGLASEGYPIDVLSLRTPTEPFEQVVAGVRVYGMGLARAFGGKLRYLFEYGAFFVWAFAMTAWLHLRRRYSLVQVHNLPDTLILAALVPKLLGAYVVLDAHEAMPESLGIKFGWSEKDPRRRLAVGVEMICMGLADHIFTIHEPMKQLFVRRGESPDRISVMMNWPDSGLFRHVDCDQTRRHDGFTLMYAGTIAERYGLQTAIKALPQLAREIPGVRLRILGKGDYVGALQQLAEELGIDGIISFERPVPLVDVPSLYRTADVGIAPVENLLFGDIYFSTKAAEYLAVGLPAVVSRTPIMARYFDEDEVAFFEPGDHVDFAERVLEIYRDEDFRHRLVENGLAMSARHNWTVEREKYMHVVASLTGTHDITALAAEDTNEREWSGV